MSSLTTTNPMTKANSDNLRTALIERNRDATYEALRKSNYSLFLKAIRAAETASLSCHLSIGQAALVEAAFVAYTLEITNEEPSARQVA